MGALNLAVLSREENLYAGSIEDISERKQAEAARESAVAQPSEKTDLLARAHEVARLGTFVIDSRSRTMFVAVQLSVEDVGRHAPTVEEAVYFCVREAIQNAAKHAGPGTQLTLSLQRGEEGFEFEIADDGSGFEPRERSDGHGLASMQDRSAAVDGTLDHLRPAPGLAHPRPRPRSRPAGPRSRTGPHPSVRRFDVVDAAGHQDAGSPSSTAALGT